MIKAEINKQKVKLTCSGTIIDYCNDLTNLIRGIVDGIDDDMNKRAFMMAFMNGIDEGIVFGVDKSEIDEMKKENVKITEIAKSENIKKELKDMLKTLSDIEDMSGNEGMLQ